jgi:glyoxylate reductase
MARVARVFVTRQLPGTALARLAAAHSTVVWPERLPPTPEQLTAGARDADALVTTVNDRVDAVLLAAAPHLRIIANYAVGYDNIDIEAATARGIAVTNTPDALTEATADLTWALLLAAARQLVPAAANARSDWQTFEPRGFLGADVAGATLGIIGPGRIGQAVARRAVGFDMTVLTARQDRGELADLLAAADFVSLHCPLTPATRHLIDADTLAQMRPTAILVNTARGPIVDQVALAAALHADRLQAAALDVTDPEPLPATDPLWRAPRLLITPHIGSASATARARMADMAVANVLAGLAGEPLIHPVPAR